jgi:Domain of unknown function (DUF4190)/GYF domain 2
MQIHIARNGQAMGPFSLEEVNRQLAAGTLSGSDLGWYEGAAGWAPLSSVPGVTVGGAAPSTPTPAPAPAAAAPATPMVTTPAPGGAVRYPAAPVAPTEPLAIWSFVLSLLGVLGFCCGPIPLVAGVICGHLALPKFRARPELQGRGLAIAGLVIGYAVIAGWIIWVLFLGGVAALQGILESTKK